MGALLFDCATYIRCCLLSQRNKVAFSADTESQIPMQLQCVHTGLGTVADIAGFHPGEELVGKPVSPEVGQLRAGDFQIHIVAPDGILILIQGLFISFLDGSCGGLGATM